MKVGNNTVVTLTYTLHNDTKEGAVIDQATKDRPLEGIFGHGMFLPRFEENLQGLEPGDTFGFRLTPAEGYGEFNQEMVYTVKKDMFMDEKGNLSELCKEGNTLQFNVGDGNILPGTIKKVTAELVEIDFNHQLAGVPLFFEGEIIAVRELREEDMGGGCGHCHHHQEGEGCDSCGGGCDSCK
jgi:FKBP-type peptidyl-prolyl cis-trans isomerase SlyD